MKNILCILGIHKWDVYYSERIIIPGEYVSLMRTHPMRMCTRCYCTEDVPDHKYVDVQVKGGIREPTERKTHDRT